MGSIIPYIPETITVHLGVQSADAPNVTVSFPDYIKNVASSEVYPTWEPAALRANILAQLSFALNRVYTEYYPSRGYAFNITNSTVNDQRFVNGRNIFENISQLVDEIFNSYIRRKEFLEPLLASFCNGTTVTCSGMSQWGSQNMALEGVGYEDILYYYYTSNIEFITGAPVQPIQQSYPGYPITRGDSGIYVGWIQFCLNRISNNYPSIPKLTVDQIFGELTEQAVVRFQQIFDLPDKGAVDNGTWYALIRIYVAVTGLAELYSQGQTLIGTSFAYPDAVEEGDTGLKVQQLQYMLAVLSDFYSQIPPLLIQSVFGPETTLSVQAFQRLAGLPVTGVVNAATWDAIYQYYIGAETEVPPESVLGASALQYPGEPVTLGQNDESEATA